MLKRVIVVGLAVLTLVGHGGWGAAAETAGKQVAAKWDLWGDPEEAEATQPPEVKAETHEMVAPVVTPQVEKESGQVAADAPVKSHNVEQPALAPAAQPVDHAEEKQEAAPMTPIPALVATPQHVDAVPVAANPEPAGLPPVSASSDAAVPVAVRADETAKPAAIEAEKPVSTSPHQEMNPEAAPVAVVRQEVPPQEEKTVEAVKMPAALTPGSADVAVIDTAAYIIGPGDVLDISVWKDEALTKSVVVLPDGKISFPLVGVVVAEGRTVVQLKKEIETKLRPYIEDLVLSVEVHQSNSMMVYIIGRVNQPGRQVLNTKVNVLQALAMAGGLNPFANRDKIKVFREENGKKLILPFHYSDVVDGKDLESNVELKRGDVVVVP